MEAYLSLLDRIMTDGERREDRTGTGTLSIFGEHLRFDLSAGFPVVTTKRLHWRAVVGELLWFIEGSTNRNRLEQITYGTTGEHSTIWDEWAVPSGYLGPIYGAQWRGWWREDRDRYPRRQDQLQAVINDIMRNPYSRRHVVSAWNVSDLPDQYRPTARNVYDGRMALAPCHCLFQFYVSTSGRLSCHLYQRSADVFLGLPFNIASYALLTHMVATVTGYMPGSLHIALGDVHLYRNHEMQAREQLGREPRPLPRLDLTPRASIDDYRIEDARLIGYEPHPAISAPVAI